MVKRSKKQNNTTDQLCLFKVAPVRQEEGTRRKPKKKPVEASRSAAPTLIPPAPVEALERPENSLKMEISDREELRHLWKEDPEALHALDRMAKKNPAVLELVRRLVLVPFCIGLLFSCGKPAENVDPPEEDICSAPRMEMEQAVSFLALAEGWHDPARTGCTGWGHRTCYDGARVGTPTEADSLAASDLRALCARFRHFQGDSLLLALLAYNVGVKAVKTSSLMDSLTFDAYTSFCYIKGRRSEKQFQRRRAEWVLFKN